MALNVQWNWRMPAVGDPNNQANSVAQGLQTGAEAFAKAIDAKRDRVLQDKWKTESLNLDNARLAQQKEQFAHQVEQDQLAQMNRNREFWQQKALNDARLKQMEQELAQKKQQQEWMDKMYANYFGDVNPELKALREKFGNSSDAALVMNGLNPLFMK